MYEFFTTIQYASFVELLSVSLRQIRCHNSYPLCNYIECIRTKYVDIPILCQSNILLKMEGITDFGQLLS